ncbi:MAG TPA: hypothetical protein VEF06_08115 [Bryobacteraceae bacterium]|nr:hypothetical protein [Bryobacteraceae bacterium]
MKSLAVFLIALTALAQSPDRLKAKVAAMLKADQDNPPTAEGVLFVGGGPVEGWDLRRYFGAYRTANRGISGSRISDATYYADQIIVPFKPSTIVVCLTDDDTIDAFTKFVAKIHQSLPKSLIVVMMDKPGPMNDRLDQIAGQDKLVRPADLLDPVKDYDLVSPMLKLVIQKAETRYWRGFDPVPGQ